MEQGTGTTNAIQNPLNFISFDCHSEYNRAIDEACDALDATGDHNGWATVRALREPKIDMDSSI